MKVPTIHGTNTLMKNTIQKLLAAATAFILAAVLFHACKPEQEVEPPTPPSTVSVTGVSVGKTSLSLVEGASETLSVTVAPENASNKSVSWKSSNTSVATVDSNGKVTAVKAGSSTITVTTADGSKTATCTVTVTAKTTAVTGVSLNKSTLSLVEGGSETLTATVAPDNATNKAVSWKSSSTSVATVDANGKITAVKTGSATITVTTTDGGKTATCKVTVTNKAVAVTGVKLDKTKLEITEGETAQLKATVAPENATNQAVTWKSSSTGVATVDDSGKITAVKAGSATITVTTKDGSKKATCTVTVKKKEIKVESVKIEPATLEITEGKTYQLKATVSPADADQEVEWTSSNKEILTVDKKGLVTAVKPGTANVVIRSKTYNDKQATCKVTVKQDKTLKGIALNPTEISIKVGESKELSVIYTPEYATNKTVTWTSSNTAVATVSNGVVTAKKEGTATITATSKEGSFKAKCAVTVSKADGTPVYAIVGDDLLLNGSSDPLTGSFNNSSKKFTSAWFIDTDGKDLYSAEVYNTGGSQHVWLCKNRKPFKDCNLYVKYNNRPRDFAANKGVYAFVIKESGNERIKVVRYREYDDDYVEMPISSAGTTFYEPVIAVAPNGAVHVAVPIKDSFDKRYIAWFKIDSSDNFTSKLIDNSGEPSIAVSSSGDVYIFSHKDGSGYQEGKLYKNGSLFKTIDKVEENFAGAVSCAGSDVYTLVNDYTKKEARIHKNGTKISSASFGKSTSAGEFFQVTSKGDVYFIAEDWSGSTHRLYKNGKVLYTFSKDVWGMCVVE